MHSILISGAAQGIGAATAALFYQHGYKVGIYDCLLYTSPSPRDLSTSRMPSSA